MSNKKVQAKKVDAPSADQPEKSEKELLLEQLTFTEEEHKCLVDYMNHINDYAKFDGMGVKQSYAFSTNMIKAINVVKKIESHIFEFKRKMKAVETKAAE